MGICTWNLVSPSNVPQEPPAIINGTTTNTPQPASTLPQLSNPANPQSSSSQTKPDIM
ncbi:MAG: hypothetical protein ACREBA_10865 [Nitrosotalea sp.]